MTYAVLFALTAVAVLMFWRPYRIYIVELSYPEGGNCGAGRYVESFIWKRSAVRYLEQVKANPWREDLHRPEDTFKVVEAVLLSRSWVVDRYQGALEPFETAIVYAATVSKEGSTVSGLAAARV